MGMTSLHDLSSPILQKNRPCLSGNAKRMENEIFFLFLILRCRLLYTEVIIIFNLISKFCFLLIFI